MPHLAITMEVLMEKYLNPRNPVTFGGVERFLKEVHGRVKNKVEAQNVLVQMDVYMVNK